MTAFEKAEHQRRVEFEKALMALMANIPDGLHDQVLILDGWKVGFRRIESTQE